MEFIEVSKEDFGAFLAAYPRPLVKDVYKMGDPPSMQYNDFSLGNWPESIVAAYWLNEFFEQPNDGWKVREGLVSAEDLERAKVRAVAAATPHVLLNRVAK